jgi:transposase
VRLLASLRMRTSAATVLRLVRRQPVTASAPPRVLGVDDFAFRKGRNYGTILVDLEQHKVVDVLAERTSASLAKWLQTHPSVEIVTRDRSTKYARGIRKGAPKAVQVADRWHLLLNLKQVLERWFGRVHARLRRLPALIKGYTPPTREGPFYRSRPAEAASLDSRARRLARYEEVKRLYGSGKGLLTIARETGLDRKTVRKYAYAESFPERSRKAWFSAIDPYLGYLEARHAEGCEDATQLWREIRLQGFPNSKRQVLKWMRARRRVPAPSTPGTFREAIRIERRAAGKQNPSKTKPTATPPLPGPKHLARLVLQHPETLQAEEVETLGRVKQDTEVGNLLQLANMFLKLVREQRAEQLDPWLAACEKGSIKAMRTFAEGIKQDYAAVRAALTLPWSNGLTEGKVNKLKLLKRQMYGRAHFDLLRQRVLLAG